MHVNVFLQTLLLIKAKAHKHVMSDTIIILSAQHVVNNNQSFSAFTIIIKYNNYYFEAVCTQ